MNLSAQARAKSSREASPRANPAPPAAARLIVGAFSRGSRSAPINRAAHKGGDNSRGLIRHGPSHARAPISGGTRDRDLARGVVAPRLPRPRAAQAKIGTSEGSGCATADLVLVEE